MRVAPQVPRLSYSILEDLCRQCLGYCDSQLDAFCAAQVTRARGSRQDDRERFTSRVGSGASV